MITSIEIQNLRGIADGKLDGLTELSVLIGPNGSGKSTVLDAALLFSTDQPGLAITLATSRHSGTKNPNRWFFHKGNVGQDFTIIGMIGDVHRRVHGTILSDARIKLEIFNDEINVMNIGQNDSRILAGNPISSVRMIGKFSGLEQPNVHDLFSELAVSGRSSEAINIIRDILPKVDDVKILTENGAPYLFISYPDHSVPLAIAGDGVFALAQLGLELALRPGGIALIEEPEIHLHPAAIRETAKVIWGAVRRGVQVILTTHSLELIDALLEFSQGDDELEKLSVFRTKLDEGQLKVSHFSGSSVAFARQQIGDELR